jgi:hypothetical protein
MISLPVELTEQNYCDQNPVTMEFSFEEHDLLISILCHALDASDLVIPCIYDFPEDSEVRQRYEMLNKMKEQSCDLWSKRFGSAPYLNNP